MRALFGCHVRLTTQPKHQPKGSPSTGRSDTGWRCERIAFDRDEQSRPGRTHQELFAPSNDPQLVHTVGVGPEIGPGSGARRSESPSG